MGSKELGNLEGRTPNTPGVAWGEQLCQWNIGYGARAGNKAPQGTEEGDVVPPRRSGQQRAARKVDNYLAPQLKHG